ncbi:MAG: FAD-dependent oxidoreductase [Bradymonadaceae bacterium]
MDAPRDRHDEIVERIRAQVERAREAGERPRITHGSKRVVRSEAFEHTIDVGGLDSVLAVDPDERTVTVEPNVSMRELADATLAQGLVPRVVPEFPGITVGGAIQGAGGESGSFRVGGFHRMLESAEYVLGDGRVVETSPDEHEEIFYGASCSCGSIGIITRATLSLVPADRAVELQYRRVHSFEEMLDEIRRVSAKPGDVDFLDGVVFREDLGVVMVGEMVPPGDSFPTATVSEPDDEWFYLQARERALEPGESVDQIPIRDYLFRWDRGAFWTGKYVFERVGVPYNRIARQLLDPYFHTAPMYHALHATDIAFDFVIQDICMPIETVGEFVDWIDEELGIAPLWICPGKNGDPAFLSPAALETGMVVNVGVWGPVPDGMDFVECNRELERVITELRGRKALYSHQFYPEEEFWAKFDEERYRRLRRECGAVEVFDDMWEKTHTDEFEEPSIRKAWREVVAAPWRA